MTGVHICVNMFFAVKLLNIISSYALWLLFVGLEVRKLLIWNIFALLGILTRVFTKNNSLRMLSSIF